MVSGDRWFMEICFLQVKMTFFPKQPVLTSHISLLLLINHVFFVARSTLERKQLLRLCDSRVCRVPGCLWKCARFLMPTPPPWTPPSPTPSRLMEMLAGYRCRPVAPLFEMCTPFFSLKGNVSLISPEAPSPGKKGNKMKEGLSFSKQLKPTLEKEEFVSFGNVCTRKII